MTSKTMARIMQDYADTRQEEERLAKQRKEELYQQDERIQQIDEQVRACGMQAIRACMDGDGDPQAIVSDLKDQLSRLHKERENLLAQYGYAQDYDKVRYRCPDCQDTGYIGRTRCHCLVQRMIEANYADSNLQDELKRNNFDTFDLSRFSSRVLRSSYTMSPRAHMKQVLADMKAYAQAFPDNDPHNLLFYGPPGTGKTFLCDCLAKAILDRGFTVFYMTSASLFSALEKARFSRDPSDSDKDLRQQLYTCSLLILDDLGTEVLTQVSASDLFEIVNQRLLHEKATVISTNLTPQELRRTYTDRLYSRICGSYRLIEFYGPDLRDPAARKAEV